MKKLFNSDTQDYDNLLKRVKIDITLDKVGGFKIGEGEYFDGNLDNADFLIKTSLLNNIFITTFEPNPKTTNKMQAIYNSQEDEEDTYFYRAFRNKIYYMTTLKDITKEIKDFNDTSCIYKVDTSEDEITVDDMMFFYLGFYGKEIKAEPINLFISSLASFTTVLTMSAK